jgi:hypothetical protein
MERMEFDQLNPNDLYSIEAIKKVTKNMSLASEEEIYHVKMLCYKLICKSNGIEPLNELPQNTYLICNKDGRRGWMQKYLFVILPKEYLCKFHYNGCSIAIKLHPTILHINTNVFEYYANLKYPRIPK